MAKLALKSAILCWFMSPLLSESIKPLFITTKLEKTWDIITQVTERNQHITSRYNFMHPYQKRMDKQLRIKVRMEKQL